MKSLIKRALWPAEPVAPKLRGLRAGETLPEGAVVSVAYDPHDGRKVYRWVGWQWMGRERYALLDAGDGQRYVVSEARVRVSQV
jgi:hypothetical protein